MNFAFVVNNYPPRVGGVELHVRSLARQLRGQGHRVLVITLSDAPGAAVEDGIDVVRLPERLRVGDILGFPLPGTTRHVAHLLREHRVDVVSVHTRFFPMSWVGLRAAARTGAVIIHTEHGSDHVVSTSPLITAASRAVDLTLGRTILRQATDVLGVSEHVISFVSRLSGREDASVFYNAIDPACSSLNRDHRPHLVFVGRLVPGKGAEAFVEMLRLLRAEGREVDAEILGDGVSRPEIEASIARAGLENHVAVRGRVDGDEVSLALAGAILVNPSTLAEGFQTTLLESLDAGGSVVSYDLPGVRALQRQGHPVRVVNEQGPASLARAVGELLDEGWRNLPMDDWYWPVRAASYAARAERLVLEHASRKHR